MPLAEGETFAGYTILRLLGAGGMGEVYLAQHPRLPRRDALKVLPASVSSDAEYRARFEREADVAATLWHPHIVGVHDRGETDGQLWIAMDFVEDGYLSDELGAGPEAAAGGAAAAAEARANGGAANGNAASFRAVEDALSAVAQAEASLAQSRIQKSQQQIAQRDLELLIAYDVREAARQVQNTYQRVLASPHVSPQIKNTLTAQYRQLNPAQIRRDILTLSEQLLDLVKAKHQPTRTGPIPPPATRASSREATTRRSRAS